MILVVVGDDHGVKRLHPLFFQFPDDHRCSFFISRVQKHMGLSHGQQYAVAFSHIKEDCLQLTAVRPGLFSTALTF